MHEEDFVLENRHGKRVPVSVRTSYGDPNGTVVLLHGLGGWKDQYLLVVVAESIRAQGYHVVTFDAADGAKGPDSEFSKSTTTKYLEDLKEVVTRIEKEFWFTGPLSLAAHSQGGLVAVRYARMHPKSVSKLMLIAPAVSWKIGFPLTLPLGLLWLISNKYWTPGPGPAKSKLLLKRAWLLDFIKFDLFKDAKKIKIPTIIVSAEKDNIVGSPAVHKRLSKTFTQGTQEVIARAGHIFYEHEREVADILTTWLGR